MFAKSADEVLSEYCADRGLSTRTIRTNFGLFAGAYHPNDVTVCPASPISYPHFEAICDVPVFPAIVYHGTHPVFANHF